MVSGELSVIISSCMIRSPDCQDIVQAVLHAEIGHQHLETKAIKTEKTKQFAWQQKMLFKFKDERVITFWLCDEMRKGEEYLIGECKINIECLDEEKMQLFMFYKGQLTAIIDAQFKLDQKGTTYVAPEKRSRKLIVKFNIRSADLIKDTELIGSMKPVVRIVIGEQKHETDVAKGKNPTWNQVVIFENVRKEDTVYITVLDKEMIGQDDIVGSAVKKMEEMKDDRPYTVDLRSNGNNAGMLRFDLKQYYE